MRFLQLPMSPTQFIQGAALPPRRILAQTTASEPSQAYLKPLMIFQALQNGQSPTQLSHQLLLTQLSLQLPKNPSSRQSRTIPSRCHWTVAKELSHERAADTIQKVKRKKENTKYEHGWSNIHCSSSTFSPG